MEEVEIRKVDEWNPDEIEALYRSAGWWKEGADNSAIPAMIKGSFCFVVAVDSSGRAVGMGRVVADGISDGYIQDLVVLPEYRGRGIGQRIVSELVDFCRGKLVWLGLVAEPGTSPFYEKLGFRELSGYIPMRYMGDEEGDDNA